MHALQKFLMKSHTKGRLASILFGAVLLAIPMLTAAQFEDYEGPEFCSECHEAQYNLWKSSGHPYIFMEGQNAKHRPIPLPEGHTWDDISYVIGGYNWKARFIDQDGFIITGDEDAATQYNFFNPLASYLTRSICLRWRNVFEIV